MKQWILAAAVICVASPAAWAQTQPSAQQMQQLQQSLNNPQLMQQLQQAIQSGGNVQQLLGNQTIDISKQRASLKTDCNEAEFMKCPSGYSCTSTGASGAASRTTVRGREDGLCHVSIQNSDGSTGDCHYTDATMEQMLGIYNANTITIAEAMDAGSRMMKECRFVDAKGQPFAMPTMAGMTGAAQ